MGFACKLLQEDSCSTCEVRDEHFFCGMSEKTRYALEEISFVSFYPQGTRLFGEGQFPRGVFIVCSGRAKLSISSRSGKVLTRIADSGEVLGLSATLEGRPYEGSAEMLERGQVNFVRRDQFLALLNRNPEASLRVALNLSSDYFAVHEQVKVLALSDSVAEKMARLLLSWCAKSGRETDRGIHLKFSLTHGEIAQMIGVSRETVTRLLGDLRGKGIIHLKGSNLFITDKAALQNLVAPW